MYSTNYLDRAYSNTPLSTFAPNTPNNPGASIPPPPLPGWLFSYPVGGSARDGTNANPDLGTMLNFHIAADLKRDAESIPQSLAIIGTTITGRLLLCDLSCKLNGQPISITGAIDVHQAGISADAQGRLHVALHPNTLLSHGARLQVHDKCTPFSAEKQYACGLFEFLLCAMNYFEMGTFTEGQRIDLHPRTVAFRQALLEAVHSSGYTSLVAAPAADKPSASLAVPTEIKQPSAGLKVNLDINMLPYKDGFGRMLTSLRAIAPGMQMLQGFARDIETHSIEVCHVDHPADAGIRMGANGYIHWYYNLDAVTAHAALLQTTGDDLTHEQRDACAAFDLMHKSWESIQQRQAQAGDRLDLDYARRRFRDELMGEPRRKPGPVGLDAADAVRV